jgi:hypothetical protein
MTIRIDTDLPGGDRARCWVHEDVIVVEHDDLVTVAMHHNLSLSELTRVVEVLKEVVA